MGTKSFDEGRIKSAEAVRLITLYGLFSRKESRNIIFQGGTALRWFHGNDRFSEDLDFVTPLSAAAVSGVLKAIQNAIEANFKAQFGPGVAAMRFKEGGPDGSVTAFVEYSSEKQRGKTVVKLEFERLRNGDFPDVQQTILSSAPAVAYFIRTGAVMLPPGRVINVETPGEIFSDKVRALMERGYLKGRDLFDLWFMTHALGIKPDIELVKRKLEMYEHPFVLTREPGYFLGLAADPTCQATVEACKEIDRDLSRFINEDVMNTFRDQHFQPVITAVADTFRKLLEDGLDLSSYQIKDTGPGM